MSNRYFFIFICFSLAFPLKIYCLETLSNSKSSQNVTVINLTVDEAVSMAIEKNLSIKAKLFNELSKNALIDVEKSEFDPAINFFVSHYYDKRHSISSSSINNFYERLSELTLSLEGKILTGTEYNLSIDNERFETNAYTLLINPYYTTNFSLTISQPILKDFGIAVQKTYIDIAENEYKMSDSELNHETVDIAAQTGKFYWIFKTAAYRLDSTQVSLSHAQRLQKQVRAKISAGIMAEFEIYAANAEVAIREEAVLNARKELKNSEDDLMTILELDTTRYSINPVSRPPETYELQDEKTVIENSLNRRYDFERINLDKKNKEILLNYHRNQKLPDIDALFSYEVNGIGEDYEKAIKKVDLKDDHYWQVGINVNVPIGRRKDKGNFLYAKNQLKKVEASLGELRRNIILETRQSLREVEYAKKRVSATEKSLVASKEKLDAEEGRFQEGLTTLKNVLEYQKDYANSFYEEKKAKADLAIAIIELKKVQGEITRN